MTGSSVKTKEVASALHRIAMSGDGGTLIAWLETRRHSAVSEWAAGSVSPASERLQGQVQELDAIISTLRSTGVTLTRFQESRET